MTHRLGDYVRVNDHEGEGKIEARKVEVRGRTVRVVQPLTWLVIGQHWRGWYTEAQILTDEDKENEDYKAALFEQAPEEEPC